MGQPLQRLRSFYQPAPEPPLLWVPSGRLREPRVGFLLAGKGVPSGSSTLPLAGETAQGQALD